ncbi:hypothetical protein AB0F72_08415 [Actinoplanes sp. NPDC023936]|uniref:hypothetical protein n=1 Tax=Actinoplanes sp. NPDC023936 TaxID=3154910 RepID=UPI0033F1AA52
MSHDHEYCITPDGVMPGCPDFDEALPACSACNDQGFVDDSTGETGVANCYDCNPAPEHVGTDTAEYRRWADAQVQPDMRYTADLWEVTP